MSNQNGWIIRNENLINKINKYELIPLEIELENISSRVHLNMFTVDGFLNFAREANSKHVYYNYTYYKLEDYLIPQDWYDNQVREVQIAVRDHNKLVKSLDFSMPTSLLLFILQGGTLIGLKLQCVWLEDKGIEKAEDTIEAIEDKYYREVKQVKKLKKANKIEDEKKLREMIYRDPEFKYCRNQESRYYYLVDLLEDNQDIMEEYGYLFDPFGAPHTGKVKMFMDKTWMLYKDRN